MKEQEGKTVITDKSTTGEPEYLNGKELAAKLGVSVKFISKYTGKRRVPGMVKVSPKCVRYHLPTIEKRLLSGQTILLQKV